MSGWELQLILMILKYLGVVGACATFLSSFGLGWEKIGSKKRNEIEVKTEEPLSRVATAT